MGSLFKICRGEEWAAAVAAGVYVGSAVDRADGFIHLSAAHQVRETADRHFAGQEHLVLVAVDEAQLANLVWEPSRGGQLFPHLRGTLPLAAVRWVERLPWREGAHVFPALEV